MIFPLFCWHDPALSRNPTLRTGAFIGCILCIVAVERQRHEWHAASLQPAIQQPFSLPRTAARP
jgi:hypothetical protein